MLVHLCIKTIYSYIYSLYIWLYIYVYLICKQFLHFVEQLSKIPTFLHLSIGLSLVMTSSSLMWHRQDKRTRWKPVKIIAAREKYIDLALSDFSLFNQNLKNIFKGTLFQSLDKHVTWCENKTTTYFPQTEFSDGNTISSSVLWVYAETKFFLYDALSWTCLSSSHLTMSCNSSFTT